MKIELNMEGKMGPHSSTLLKHQSSCFHVMMLGRNPAIAHR